MTFVTEDFSLFTQNINDILRITIFIYCHRTIDKLKLFTFANESNQKH